MDRPSQARAVVRHRGMERPQEQASGGREPLCYAVFESLYPRLRRFAAVVADSDIDPDDLLQDALAAVLGRHDLSEIHNPSAYLKQAILHGVMNHRRRPGLVRRFMPILVAEVARLDAYPSDLAALDGLTPLDRAVVFLLDIEGHSG